MRYKPDLQPSLLNRSFKVNPRANVGIVDHNGASKSSVLLALFRLIKLTEKGNSGRFSLIVLTSQLYHFTKSDKALP